MKRKLMLVTLLSLVLASSALLAGEKPSKGKLPVLPTASDSKTNLPGGPFAAAEVETTWFGADPTGTSVVGGGVWDFDNRGTLTCPGGDEPGVYIKNGAFAQGWTSEDVDAQKGLYWHAEGFTDAALECSSNPIDGAFSAWCGQIEAAPGECFKGGPGYGHNWNQWLCRTVTLDPLSPRLTYKINFDTENGGDYAYVIIDAEFPDSCGWVGDLADTLRCYDGQGGTLVEDIDLSRVCEDPDLCDDVATCDYSGDSVKICFVFVSDNGYDDQDGRFDSCDGAMTVDDISIDVAPSSGGTITTDFEDGTLQGWRACGGWSPGDFAAIRDRSSFINNDPNSWQGCGMQGCVLTLFDPGTPGRYGNGGHYPDEFENVVWSPPIYVGEYSPSGYELSYDAYLDLPAVDWIFYRRFVRYTGDPECPTGAWSEPVSDGYIHYSAAPECSTTVWDFSERVPAYAESIRVGFSVWNTCVTFKHPCTEGDESPIFDNVRVGIAANIKPDVAVLSPNGGETWFVDDIHDITWTATDGNGVESVDIYYSTNGGSSFTLIASGEENDGAYPWTVPNTLTDNALVRIRATDPSMNVGEDVSDAPFSIAVNVPPAVTVVAPNGGEVWNGGDVQDITWTATDIQGVDSVAVYYSINGGADYTLIASGEPNDGVYEWTVPNALTDDALVKVKAFDPSLMVGEDVSDAPFSIVDVTPPAVTVSSPDGGETWYTFDSENITWTATDAQSVSSVSIYYSTNGGADYVLIASGEANDGSYPWSVPNTPTDSALVKVRAFDSSLNVGEDVSDSLFAIVEAPMKSPPRLTLSVHQNPELTAELDIYLVPSEALEDTSVSLAVNGSQLAVVRSDTMRSIYVGDYHLAGSGVITISAHARNLAGKAADTTRAFGAGLVAERDGGSSTGPLGRVSLSCQPYSVRGDTYVLVLPEGNHDGAWSESAMQFVLSPPGLVLDRPARLTVQLSPGEGTPRLWLDRPSGWEAVESSYSKPTRTLSALIGELGRYRVTWEESGEGLEEAGLLLRAAPSPFRTAIGVSYHLPLGGEVRVAVCDVAGRRVRTLVDKEMGPGWHSESWDGSDDRGKTLPSGVYFIVLESGAEKVSGKCVLMK
jgi:hypothetical protein